LWLDFSAMSLIGVVRRLFGRGGEPPLALGKAALERKDYDAALRYLSEALRRQPAASEAHFYLGVLRAEQGEQRAALGHYLRCLELGGRSPNLLNNLAATHASLGEIPAATRRYEEALALEPNHSEACTGLGRMLQEQGDYARALELYDRALRREPGAYAASFHKAQILLVRGEFKQGFKHFAARPNRVFSPERQRYKFVRGALPRDLRGKSVIVLGGGVIGVVNRQLGIGSFAPRLDSKGNSVRGVKTLRMLSDDLGLHAFECTNTGSTFIEHLIS